MMQLPQDVQAALGTKPRTWLVTGCAGFIGSNLVELLLNCGQQVVGVDNFATGQRSNLEDVAREVGHNRSAFRFIEGDVSDPLVCREACRGVDIVLHQAALGSVPRSIDNPLATNNSNINGFLNVLVAARDAGVERFVYAASSSTYGDHPALPKREDRIGRPLSPYAVTKYVNELYAQVFQDTYGIPCIGLRYFNVFGRRQDPNGAYAAVIPRWISALLAHEPLLINGDGETTRDFCYIDNVLQANMLAALRPVPLDGPRIFNVAVGERTTLNQLFELLRSALSRLDPDIARAEPAYTPFRVGDVRHSQADISRAREALGYAPSHSVREGIEAALPWYVRAFGTAAVQEAAADESSWTVAAQASDPV